jgi:hypothetical protein
MAQSLAPGRICSVVQEFGPYGSLSRFICDVNRRTLSASPSGQSSTREPRLKSLSEDHLNAYVILLFYCFIYVAVQTALRSVQTISAQVQSELVSYFY